MPRYKPAEHDLHKQIQFHVSSFLLKNDPEKYKQRYSRQIKTVASAKSYTILGKRNAKDNRRIPPLSVISAILSDISIGTIDRQYVVPTEIDLICMHGLGQIRFMLMY